MPYTVRFVAKQPFADGALLGYFEQRPHVTVEADTFRYSNRETGVSFTFTRESVGEAGDAVVLTVDVPRAPFFAFEA